MLSNSRVGTATKGTVPSKVCATLRNVAQNMNVCIRIQLLTALTILFDKFDAMIFYMLFRQCFPTTTATFKRGQNAKMLVYLYLGA